MMTGVEFADRWTVRGSAGELFHRAAHFLDHVGADAVDRMTLDRDGDDYVLTVAFDHEKLAADLDYLDPRMAAGHFDEAPCDDVGFLVALADEIGAQTIVDFGCGTGQLAVALATDGRRVIGIDPAKAMLDLARTRAGAARVEWILGDARMLGARDADLVTMTGNIPSIYVTDDGWSALLRAIHAALRSGGRLAFHSWNPETRPWEQWNGVLVDAAQNRVRLDYVGTSEDGSETIVSGSEWRYRTHAEFVQSLAAAGFVVEQVSGDWHGTPLTAISRDIVIVARRA